MGDLFQESDELDDKLKELNAKIRDLQDTKGVYQEVLDDADEARK